MRPPAEDPGHRLRLRIALLEDLVDRFVVIEAHQTHTGKPKPLVLAESGAADLLQHPKVVVRAGIGHLFEAPHDTTHAILRRVREVTLPPRLRLGGMRFGYAGRSQWPRLPLTADRGSAAA